MDDDLVTVGIIRGVRGLRGQLRVESLSDFPERFSKGQPLQLNDMPREIVNVFNDKKGLIVELDGIDSREAAEKYRGCELKIDSQESGNLNSENSYFHHEIIGMAVLDENNTELGTVKEIIETGANDVYVVSNSIDKDILIPAISSVVGEVCVGSKTMRITLPKGLNTRN